MQAMAEGGHDAEFELPRSEDEATPVFASLNDLERHLPSTPPRSDDPGSVPTEQQQQQQPKKTHKRGVRAGRKVKADKERKEQEKAQREEQRRLRMQADSESQRPVVDGQDTGEVSSPIDRSTPLQSDDVPREAASQPDDVRQQEKVDSVSVQFLETEVDVSNVDAARHYLFTPPRTPQGRENMPYTRARVTLEEQARVFEEPLGKMEMARDVRHFPSIGATNGRLLLHMGFIYQEPPSSTSSQSSLPGVGRGARPKTQHARRQLPSLSVRCSIPPNALLLPPFPPPYPLPNPLPPRFSKDKLPTAAVVPSRVVPPPPRPPDLDDDDLLEMEQFAVDDNDGANFWWD